MAMVLSISDSKSEHSEGRVLDFGTLTSYKSVNVGFLESGDSVYIEYIESSQGEKFDLIVGYGETADNSFAEYDSVSSLSDVSIKVPSDGNIYVRIENTYNENMRITYMIGYLTQDWIDSENAQKSMCVGISIIFFIIAVVLIIIGFLPTRTPTQPQPVQYPQQYYQAPVPYPQQPTTIEGKVDAKLQQKVIPNFCPNCGSQKGTANFCPNCGYRYR
jgi:hypothetical protein